MSSFRPANAAADELREAALAVAAEPAESLAVDFAECLTKQRRSARPWLPSQTIFRPQNCGAVTHTLHATGRVQDDPRLSRLYRAMRLQRGVSTTNVERAADRKLVR